MTDPHEQQFREGVQIVLRRILQRLDAMERVLAVVAESVCAGDGEALRKIESARLAASDDRL